MEAGENINLEVTPEVGKILADTLSKSRKDH
jgi:hypothetical protein